MTNTAILPHEPKKPAPFSTRGQWILFWVTLVLVGTWAILVQTDRAPELPSWIREPWFVFPLLLVVIVTIGIRQQRAIRKFNVLNLEALDMQARGDGVGALARMEELEKSWPRPRAVRVVVQLNCAWLLLRQGELWRAIEHYGQLDAQRRPGEKFPVWYLLTGHMAVAHALAGELDAAVLWLAEFERRAPEANAHVRLDAGVEVARAIVDCRRGKHAEVASRLAKEWFFFESILTGVTLRPFRAVRAFALACSGDSANRETQLAVLRGGPANEFSYLGVQWPEMRAFLEQHGLIGDVRQP